MDSKSEIRKRVLARRDALPAADRRALSKRITARLLALDAYRNARCVMAYVSFGSEYESAGFISDLLAHGKTLVLPRVESESHMLRLHSVRDPREQLEAGVWGIRQPRADLCPEVSASRIDFVLVPGVAFTRQGQRLGYGGGYYDRLIKEFARRPPLVAAAFSLQILPALPVSERDQHVDCVVTENAEYHRHG
ncbi:MAG TPA: 5-formyltetrahydrofolate cyclo-ligase [Burkholderiales bacterium]|nr:5-formyltetrahydrofolate cyclo-ligase [Burkholderiales bacterium]